KLMLNAVFGKTMEDVRKRINYILCSNPDNMKRAISKPTFQGQATIFHKNLVGYSMKKQKVKLNKPIYTGQCILDDSKVHMRKFYYEVLQPKYGIENVRLVATDTDSLKLLVFTEDIYKDLMDENLRNY